MDIVDVTPEEMAQRIVRFKDMTPRPKPDPAVIPPAVTDFLTADRNYSYLAPPMAGASQIQRFAHLAGGDAGDAISVSLAVCSPGRGPALHSHANTVEAFFCLSSRFAISWGERGEHAVVLEPWDFVHVPKGVIRTFHNVGDGDGALLVIIQGDNGQFDDVEYSPHVVDQIVERFGADTLAAMEAKGGRFGRLVS